MSKEKEVITDHAIVASDRELGLAIVAHQGTEEECRILVQGLQHRFPGLRLAVVDKDYKVVYAVRVLAIHISTVLIWVGVVLAFGAWLVWG